MKLSIVIIEYHCMHQVKDCIESINQYLHALEIECLIISNSEYSENELNAYQDDLPGTKVINAHGNLGYAGGVNAGIKNACGEYIYVLNPDCLLTDTNINLIIERMEKEPEWAIAGPKVIDENSIVQPSCRRFPKLLTFLFVRSALSLLPGAKKERARYLMEDFDRNSIRKVDWVSGGAILLKSSTLEKIGGMDERYFLYMEDVDWCRTVWEQGHKVVYCPISTVVHAGQHQSIKFGLGVFKNMHLRWHLKSLFKYFKKYGFREKPESDFYRNEAK